MQHSIDDAVLANGGPGDLAREAEIEVAIRLAQGTICIGDLIGLGIEKVKSIKLGGSSHGQSGSLRDR